MRVALGFLAILAQAASLGVLALVIGAFADPTGSLFAVVGSMVWATWGPFLVLVALAALLVAIAGPRRRGPLRLALPSVALAGSVYILLRIVLAATSAGASIDAVATLRPGPMDAPAPDVVEVFDTVDGTALRAAVYRPDPAEGPAPVMVYVHGGGFRTGSFTETAADLSWFADRGWLVVSVEYRLFTPGNPTWDRAARDAACGLVWAAQHAARWGGDPARLVLLGDSAGGNLALNIGFAAASGRATRDCGGQVPVPRAIATLYPAVDVASIYTDGFPIPGFAPVALIEGFLGGPPAAHPDRVAAVSPATWVTPVAPPTLIVLPAQDSLVVAHGTRAFVAAATAAGADITLVTIPFANHVFNQMAAQTLGNQIGRSLRQRFLSAQVR